jgi:serine phosphatase RsbU (regulator of sigma subunit)
VTGAQRGFLMLKNSGGELEVRVARDHTGLPLEAGDLRVPRSLIQTALLDRRDLLSMTIDPREQTGTDKTVLALELRSVVCVPLVRIRVGLEHETSMVSPRQDTLGVLYMDSRDTPAVLSEGKQELLQSLAIEISTLLENARLLAEQRDKQELEQELRIARQIQQSLLPAELPREGWLVAAGRSESCFEVGGDYFDVVRVDPRHWGAVVADVSGKGVSAALLTSLLQGAFFSIYGLDSRPSEGVARLNRYILERSMNARFATVFWCLVSDDGTMHWLNAGHCAAIVTRAAGGMEVLEPTTVPLGVLPDSDFSTRELRLAPGDKIVIYSDGVTEAVNIAREQFGDARLREVIARNAAADVDGLYEALHSAVTGFVADAPPKDDFTLLVLAYQGLR